MTVVINIQVRDLGVSNKRVYPRACKKLAKLYGYKTAEFNGWEGKTLADQYHFYSYTFTLEGGYKITK